MNEIPDQPSLEPDDKMDCLKKLCRSVPVEVEPGIYFDVPRDTYDNIPALSATALKKWIALASVPEEFAAWLTERWSEPPTDALTCGSALDCMLLEHQRFAERFAVMPNDAPRRPTLLQRHAKKPSAETARAVDWWEDFEESAAGKTVLTADQHTACLEMMLALRKAPAAQGVFEHCRKAVLVGELWGIPCKCETDLWNDRIPHMLDLKSSKDVRPHVFVRDANSYQYIEQAVFYLSLAEAIGIEKDVFTFLAVRNVKPWSVMAYNFAPAAVSDHQIIGSRIAEVIESAARELVRRLEKDDFLNDPDWQFLEFPKWQVNAASFGAARNVFSR